MKQSDASPLVLPSFSRLIQGEQEMLEKRYRRDADQLQTRWGKSRKLKSVLSALTGMTYKGDETFRGFAVRVDDFSIEPDEQSRCMGYVGPCGKVKVTLEASGLKIPFAIKMIGDGYNVYAVNDGELKIADTSVEVAKRLQNWLIKMQRAHNINLAVANPAKAMRLRR